MKYFTALIFLLGLFTNVLSAQEVTFENTPDEEHMVLMVLSEKWADLNDISKGLTRYNFTKHSNESLSTTRLKMDFISAKKPVMQIKSFPNKEAAMRYYHQFKATNPDFAQMGTVKKVYAISKSNFQAVLRAKSIKEYETFFKENYGG